MTDRVPLQLLGNGAIRYGIYNANGSLNRYEYIKIEDGATVTGTLLNKANLLSDTTAAALVAALGGSTPTTPNEAFAKLAAPSTYQKLLSFTVGTAATSISLDLSGITMANYAELMISATIYTVETTTINMTVNSLTSGYHGTKITDSYVTAISNAANFGAITTFANGTTLQYPIPILLRVQAPYSSVGTTGIFNIEFSGGLPSSSPVFGHCYRVTTAELSSIQFAAASGNIMVGSTFYVYGVKK